MNLTHLIELTMEETGQTKIQTEATLKAAFQNIFKLVASGEPVRLSNLGTFKASWRPASEETNILTGELIITPAARVVEFVPTKAFKEAVNK